MNDHYMSLEMSKSEALWTESESLRQVKQLAIVSSKPAVAMVTALLGMMYPYVDYKLWLIWLALHLVILLLRMLHIADIKRRSKKKYDYWKNVGIVGLIAFAWGSTAYPLLIGHISNIKIIILNLILIYGIASTINLARHLQTLNIFLASYGFGLLGVATLNIAWSLGSEGTGDSVAVFIFLCLFIFSLFKIGKEINKAHIQNLLLQFKNKRLIESLIVEKQTAVNAVDLKNRIMASATHDMRQPILALDLYADMVSSDPEMLPKLVPKISQATQSVITMFDAMFDLARMSMNQLTPQKIRFNLKDIISALDQQYQGVAKEKGLQLRVQYKNTNLEIIDDPILLRRILSNLISNAIKYTETGGILLVCRECNKYGFRVEVWDTGVGISPSMQEAVFSEFYKNPENTGTSEGFGLGLAIVAQLCVLLGHKLTMKSRRGHGTVVSIRLSDSVATK
jgi:signal transduction histidine kinase